MKTITITFFVLALIAPTWAQEKDQDAELRNKFIRHVEAKKAGKCFPVPERGLFCPEGQGQVLSLRPDEMIYYQSPPEIKVRTLEGGHGIYFQPPPEPKIEFEGPEKTQEKPNDIPKPIVGSSSGVAEHIFGSSSSGWLVYNAGGMTGPVSVTFTEEQALVLRRVVTAIDDERSHGRSPTLKIQLVPGRWKTEDKIVFTVSGNVISTFTVLAEHLFEEGRR